MRILRNQLGLAPIRSSSFSKHSLINFSSENKSRFTSPKESTIILAEESLYGTLIEKKMNNLKSTQKLNLRKSDLIKQRDSLTQKLLANLDKNFGGKKKYNSLLEFFDNRKKILSLFERTEQLPISVYHFKNFSNLRITEDYKINTPKLCLHSIGHKCKVSLKNVTFKEVFESLASQKKTGEINLENFHSIYQCESDLMEKIKMFVYDEKTVIPYIILSSRMVPIEKTSRKQYLFIINDIFDNFCEYINYYQNLLNEESRNWFIVLFNYPGQLFTIFDETRILNNEEISKVLDSLVFYLERENKINLKNDFIKMAGFGYGGNILSYFASNCEGAFKPLVSLMLLNSFIYLDEMLYEKLVQLKSLYQSDVDEELTLHYYFQMTQTSEIDNEKIKGKLLKNPLQNNSKIFLLEGCLANVNCQLKIQNCETLIYVVHSLQNSFVSIIHADILNNIDNFEKTSLFTDDKITRRFSHITQKRTPLYLNGGHNILEVRFFLIFF